jgi:hypothetical protein
VPDAHLFSVLSGCREAASRPVIRCRYRPAG